MRSGDIQIDLTPPPAIPQRPFLHVLMEDLLTNEKIIARLQEDLSAALANHAFLEEKIEEETT